MFQQVYVALESPQNEPPIAPEITPATPEFDEQVEAVTSSRFSSCSKEANLDVGL